MFPYGDTSLRPRYGYMCVYIHTDRTDTYMVWAGTLMLASACSLPISKIPCDPCESVRESPKVDANNPRSVSVGSEVGTVGWSLRRSQGLAILEFMPNDANRRTYLLPEHGDF